MKKIGIIIYARTTSRRLPGKVLKILNDKITLLELVHDRVKKKSKNIVIIVNTSKLYFISTAVGLHTDVNLKLLIIVLP